MKIEKAIEILTFMGKPEFEGHTEDILKARQLGIEALIAWRQYRRKKAPSSLYLLPGETEE